MQPLILPHPLASALSERRLLVVGFCAAWCNTCGEFRIAFDGLSATRDDATFVWLDIEDDADVAGDVDIENFPTIAIFDRRRLVHFGVSLPQPAILARLLASIDETSRSVDADAGLQELPMRLAAMDPGAAARALRNP